MHRIPEIPKAELATLRAAGIQPTDDEIVWLASLGEKVHNPTSGPLVPSSHGLTVGPLTLYPLTIQANIWMDRIGEYLGDMQGLYAIAFAMLHAREPGAFAHLGSLKTAAEAIMSFATTCPVTAEELAVTIERIQDQDEQSPEATEEDEPTPSYERTIAAVVAATGIPHDQWQTKTITEVSDVLLLRRMMDDDGFDVDKYESAEALKQLLRAVVTIREAHA